MKEILKRLKDLSISNYRCQYYTVVLLTNYLRDVNGNMYIKSTIISSVTRLERIKWLKFKFHLGRYLAFVGVALLAGKWR